MRLASEWAVWGIGEAELEAAEEAADEGVDAGVDVAEDNDVSA